MVESAKQLIEVFEKKIKETASKPVKFNWKW
jgi:hypothetical protein